MERIIEVMSKDKRYRREPYPSRPALHSAWNVFLTGQHIEPNNPDTVDFLTTEEMRDPSKMTVAKAKKFPHASVINPDNVTLINHRRKLNLTPVDETKAASKYPGDYKIPQDFALYKYILEREFVARSESEYVSGKHFFYLLDKEKEAVEKISRRQLRFSAEEFLRKNVTISQYTNIALLLNYKVKNFNISLETMTPNMIQEKLLDACDTYPEVVLGCDIVKNPKVAEELFVLKLMNAKFLEQRSGSYYDGEKFLGSTVPEIIATFNADESIKAKFSRLLNAE